MNGPQVTHNLPHLLLFIVIFSFFVFVVIAYFTGTGLKGGKKKLHQTIFYRLGQSLKERFFTPLFLKIRRLLFQAVGPIYDSIKQVREALKENIASEDYLYRVPWFAVVGDDVSDKAQLLSNLALSHPIDSPKFGLPENDPLLSWWFFEKGIVVDVAEKCLYATPKSHVKSDWQTFLKALAKYRPSRPLDGVILTIPAQYFYGKNKLAPHDLQKRAEMLSAQLIQTEKFLGFKLPIYCIITGLEAFPGFEGFCHEILPASRQEMFGWSSDYPTDVPYKSEWVKDAFKKMEGFLFEGILSIFSRGKVEDYGDDMVVFLKEFSHLAEGVGSYLDTVFRVSDYGDHFILRGIYNVGVGKSSDVALERTPLAKSGIVTASTNQSPWFFLNDLLQEKIFPERGIALPIKRFLRSTNRAITYLKLGIIGASLLSLLSLYLGYGYITRATAEIQPALVKVLEDLHLHGNKNLVDSAPSNQAFKERAHTVLDLVAKASHWSLTTPLLLPSMASSMNDRLYRGIVDVYNTLIAHPMYISFDQTATKLTQGDLPGGKIEGKIDEDQMFHPRKTPEFLALAGYADALAELHEMMSIYDSLEDTKDAASLSKVVKYLYDFDFPGTFLEDQSPLKEKLMTEARYQSFSLESYKLSAEKRLYQLHNAFLERIVNPEYIYGIASSLQATLEKIDAAGTPKVEFFYQALLQIRAFISFASLNGAAWLIRPEFNLGGGYKEMLGKLDGLGLFSSDMTKGLLEKSNKLHGTAVHYLKSYGSPLTGYFLATSPTTRNLEPSQGLLDLEKGIGLFLHKPFMSKVDRNTFARTIPENQLLHWDRRIIKNAIELIDNYESFVEKELPGYPAGIQDTLKVVGLEQMQHNIENMLERAQTFFEVPAHAWGKQAEDAARLQVDNVRHVGPFLLKLLSKLDSVGSKKTYTDLRSLVFAQMYQNLKQLDKVLIEGDYYLPLSKDLSWWKGEKKILLKAYGMHDKQEMQNYFDNQTQHIMQMITEYGAPVMEVLNAESFPMSIDEVVTCARWNRLLEASVAYQNKKAGGSLKALETFLVDEGNDVTEKDCLDKFSEDDVGENSGDYFLQKRNDVRKMVFKQCQKLNADKAVDQYNKIAEYFNSFMANTFPFTNGVPNGSKIAADVSDKVLQEFFGEFDKLTPQMYEAIKSSHVYGENLREVHAFLLQMGKVRAFMDKYFAPKSKEGDPGVDFKVEFRQNEMRDKYGDQVLDWAVVVGDQTSSLKEGNKTIRWEFGKNVAFGFQWAMDAPLQPVEREDIAALVKLGGRSMYVYQGYWALLRAILLHKTPPQEGGSTRNDTLLKFEIPVAPNPAMDAVENAVLFIRLIPQTSKGLSDLAFKIPAFPIEAPRLIKESKRG